jgi:hypothetical protein
MLHSKGASLGVPLEEQISRKVFLSFLAIALLISRIVFSVFSLELFFSVWNIMLFK